MAAPASVIARRRDRLFYLSMAIAAAILVFIGFSRTYFLKHFFDTPSLPTLIHLHGLLFSLWIVLFFTQVFLISSHRVDVHRRVGLAVCILAIFMTIIGPIVAIQVTKPGFRSGQPMPLQFLPIPFLNILAFAIFVASGYLYRRKPDTHKRLMLLATISLLPAAVSRIPLAFIPAHGPIAFYGLADLVLLVAIVYDAVAHRRLHPVYIWGTIVLVATQYLSVAIGPTSAWLSFARWLTT
jgi:hypothetical protein